MINFVEKQTGNVYNGGVPYIHWFDGIQSIGLNYSKSFIILSDTDTLSVKLESEVFFLVDDNKLNEFVTLRNKEYLDLSKITSNTIQLDGVQYQDKYLFNFNIIAKGKYVGEVTEIFTINGEQFLVGADFNDENESLSINLKNFGMDIPNEIQRAIYNQNIHEQKTDYVLLNRKFKELLNEYINTIANKGSYKSLINSLKWFEYGDLVEIFEYWRHDEPTRKILSKNDISQYINEKIEYIISAFQKTTYISLCCALTNYKTEDGQIVYIPETEGKIHSEPNPLVDNVSMKWTRDEMSLKMVLLGNFFATYFMPIHLDLIHSTVEDVVFSDTIKVAYLPKFERFDYIDNLPIIKCKLDKLYHLDNVEVFTNSDTPFGLIHTGTASDPFTIEDNDLEIFGVDLENDETQDIYLQQRLMTKHFNGIGAVIPFKCKLLNVSNGNYITDAKIYVYRNGTLIFDRDTDKINHTPTDNCVNIDFNILLQETGSYTVQIIFNRTDGCTYTKTFEFVVDGERNQNINLFKLVERYDGFEDKRMNFSIEKWIEDAEGDVALPFGNIADYVIDPVKDNYLRTYKQFFASNYSALKEKVHLNQVIIVKHNEEVVPEDVKVTFTNTDGTGMIYTFPDMLNQPDMKWYCTQKYRDIDYPGNKIIAEMDGKIDTYWFGINIGNVGDKKTIEYKIDTVEDEANVWISNQFIPYFYTLKKAGDIEISEQMLKDLTPEEIYRKQNSQDVYEIEKDDVVCFLPELKCINRPDDFMWKFICVTTNEEITPITFRNEKHYKDLTKLIPSDNILKLSEEEYAELQKNYQSILPEKLIREFPTILQPLFGRFDFSILPSAGYYDVILNYKLDKNGTNNTRTISSNFLIKK